MITNSVSEWLVDDTGETSGELVFADLAANERLSQTGAVGDTRREAGAINRSLHAFSRILVKELSTE